MQIFWIAVMDSITKKPARLRVEGRPLKFKQAPGMDFFAYVARLTDCHISELITGRLISKADTRKAAINAARKYIIETGADVIRERIVKKTSVMELPLHSIELFGK